MVITFTSCCRAADVLALHWRLLLFWVLLLRSLLLFLFGVGVVATSVAGVRDTYSSCSCCSWSPSSRLQIRKSDVQHVCKCLVCSIVERPTWNIAKRNSTRSWQNPSSPSICGCLVQHSPSKPVASGSSRSRECWLWLNGFSRYAEYTRTLKTENWIQRTWLGTSKWHIDLHEKRYVTT